MARAVYLALKPSNIEIPKGMEIRMTRRGSTLDVRIVQRGRLETLVSTTEEVLADMETAVEALKVASE